MRSSAIAAARAAAADAQADPQHLARSLPLMTIGTTLLLTLAALASTCSATRTFSSAQRDEHHLRSAGLDATGRTALGQDGSLAKFPTNAKGVFFSGAFTDHVVLQRDEKAAVYGVVVGAAASATVSVEMTGSTDAGEPLGRAGPIAATVDPSTIAKFGYARWKAELPVQKAGGNYTIVASSPGTNSSTITDVTFGDVWFCSGQVGGLAAWCLIKCCAHLHSYRLLMLLVFPLPPPQPPDNVAAASYPVQHVAGHAFRHQPQHHL